jgi:uncharacterized protein YgfB (UPF0149 family)
VEAILSPWPGVSSLDAPATHGFLAGRFLAGKSAKMWMPVESVTSVGMATVTGLAQSHDVCRELE